MICLSVTRRFYESRPTNSYEISTGEDVSVEQRLHKDFVRSFENTPYYEQSIYYEIRESMMVRPTTVYGRQLSIIRTSCNDNSVDQDEHVQLSLKRLDLNRRTEYWKQFWRWDKTYPEWICDACQKR